MQNNYNEYVKEAVIRMTGQEGWNALMKADNAALKRMQYLVVCETCKKVFFETSLEGAKELFMKVVSVPFVPYRWYIEAARHFVEYQWHSIRAFMVDGNDRKVVMDLSSEWKLQFPQQKAMLKKGVNFEKAMQAELDYLEEKSIKAYGKWHSISY